MKKGRAVALHRFKYCILHIGTAKTATTTIQSSFRRNRQELSRNGILYPSSPGRQNHIELAVYSVDDSRSTAPKKHALHKAGCDIIAYRRRLEARLNFEFSKASQETLLLSSEHLHANLKNLSEKKRLKALLDKWCDKYKIIVYLRRQDLVAVSLFSTRLKAGHLDALEVLPKEQRSLLWFYDYQKLLKDYSEVFGRASLDVRVFERARLKNADILCDIYGEIGIADLRGFKRVRASNASLSASGQKILAGYNTLTQRMPTLGQGHMRMGVNLVLEAIFPGKGRLPFREEASAFYHQFDEGNGWVRDNFFADQNTLFDECFDDYPLASASGLPFGKKL